MQESIVNYYRTQQTSQQWVDFLLALAAELSSQASESELRLVFSGVGKRQALLLGAFIEHVQTLDELQDALNHYWSQQHWGCVRFEEATDYVEILHSASPLSNALGENALPWSIGYFEGFYEQVFKVLGAGQDMRVLATGSEEEGLNLYFRFGRP